MYYNLWGLVVLVALFCVMLGLFIFFIDRVNQRGHVWEEACANYYSYDKSEKLDMLFDTLEYSIKYDTNHFNDIMERCDIDLNELR